MFFLMACISMAHAQDVLPSDDPSSEQPQLEDEVFVSPVIVEGDELFFVRGSTALPANERAEKVEDRIIEFASSSDKKTLTVRLLKNEFGTEIQVDGRMMTITTDADADFEQIGIEVLAGLQAEAIEMAILAYRENRSGAARVGSAVAAFVWTVLFLGISYLFFHKRKVAMALLNRVVRKRFLTVEEKTQAFIRGKAIASLVGYVANIVLWIGYLGLFYYYLSFVLLAFAETRPIATLLLNYVSKPMSDFAWGAISYLPNMIALVIIAIITRVTLQGLAMFFANIEQGVFVFKNFESHWIAPTHMLVRIFTIVIALVFAYPYIPGSDSQAFRGLTILAGVMLSLGSNTVVSNMMAGLFVIYRRSTNIGDRVLVGDKTGDVIEIKLMETLIKSTKNEMVSIPNSQLLNSEVVNLTRAIDGKGLLVHTTVGIGYEEPPAKVEAMLIEAARRTTGLKKSPAPFVLWSKLADFAVNYEINAYSSRGCELPKILSDLHRNIYAVFSENGTQIMTPFYTADPEVPKLPDQEWDGHLAAGQAKK